MAEIGIIAVGGYDEVGRNMTAVRVGDEAVILDMGLRLDRVMIHEDVEIEKIHSIDLIKMGAIPDDGFIKDIAGKVKAIICTHGHLDHIGAVPKLAHRYTAPIISTPYTAALIEQEIAAEKKFGVENKVISLKAGEFYQITPDIQAEFIRVQHSIIDCVFIALHTPEGILLYANDFKLDRLPVLGEPPDTSRLKALSKQGVIAMITETIYASKPGKTPSERVARDLIFDALLGVEDIEKGIIVTTFSSHIARIKSIVEAALEMGRIPVLLGRSMERYYGTAIKMSYLEPQKVEICGDKKDIDRTLKQIMEDGKAKYLLIATGHQGEPGSVLNRIANDDSPFKIEPGDRVIFSANVIPNPVNEANRYAVETKLKMKGARIYSNVHVSGHAYREDHWELLRMVSPENVIPSHGNIYMNSSYAEMAEEAGYTLGDTLHVLRNGQELILE